MIQDSTTIAALVFAVVAAGVVGFQVALALGAPWAGRRPERHQPERERTPRLGSGGHRPLGSSLLVASAAGT